jgi:hypothetical protein
MSMDAVARHGCENLRCRLWPQRAVNSEKTTGGQEGLAPAQNEGAGIESLSDLNLRQWPIVLVIPIHAPWVELCIHLDGLDVPCLLLYNYAPNEKRKSLGDVKPNVSFISPGFFRIRPLPRARWKGQIWQPFVVCLNGSSTEMPRYSAANLHASRYCSLLVGVRGFGGSDALRQSRHPCAKRNNCRPLSSCSLGSYYKRR